MYKYPLGNTEKYMKVHSPNPKKAEQTGSAIKFFIALGLAALVIASLM